MPMPLSGFSGKDKRDYDLGYAVLGEGLRDVKPPVDYPSFLIFLIIALVVLIGILALAVLLRRRGRKRPLPEAPCLSPWEKALRQLDELKRQELLARRDFDGFYAAVSDILRRYIEEQFFIRAPEMTTEEFLQYLRASGELGPKHKEFLEQFMQSSDLVKFAQYTPDVSEAVQGFDRARRFVEETRPPIIEQ